MKNKILILAGLFFLVVAFLFVRFLVSPNRHGTSEVLIKIYSMQLEQYYSEFNRYPSTSEGLKTLACDELSERSKKKYCVYLSNSDPWGNEIQYLNPGLHNKDKFDVWIKHTDRNGKEYLWANWETE